MCNNRHYYHVLPCVPLHKKVISRCIFFTKRKQATRRAAAHREAARRRDGGTRGGAAARRREATRGGAVVSGTARSGGWRLRDKRKGMRRLGHGSWGGNGGLRFLSIIYSTLVLLGWAGYYYLMGCFFGSPQVQFIPRPAPFRIRGPPR